MSRNHPNVARGAVAGLVAGLAASAVMGVFMTFVGRMMPEGNQGEEPDEAQGEGEAPPEGEAMPTTEKVAQNIAEAGFERELKGKRRAVAGQAVHYAFGGLIGAGYGAAAERMSWVTTGAGVPFGTAVWLGADEIALPLLKLTRPPQESPLPLHLSALSAHFIYGFCTELGRRVLRENR